MQENGGLVCLIYMRGWDMENIRRSGYQGIGRIGYQGIRLSGGQGIRKSGYREGGKT